MADRSDLVVEGRVLGAHTFVHPSTGRPMTDTRIQVLQTLRGSAPSTGVVEVRQMRGRVDGGDVRVVGDASLDAGDHVVVFLRKGTDEEHYLTALAQSVYHVKGDGPRAPVELRLDGLFRVPAPGNEPLTYADLPATLGELRARVRGSAP